MGITTNTHEGLKNTTGDLNIINSASDGDVIIKGNDGGSTITALTLDMSAAGQATFAGTIGSGAITSTGAVEGTSFVKTGGLPSGFLKADGSVDSNTYVTGAHATDFVSAANGGTFNGNVTVGSNSLTAGSLDINGAADISGTTALGGVTTITNTSAGALTLDGGTGVSTTGAFVLRQNGDAASNGMAITSSNAASHRLWKDASGNFNIGSSSNADAFKQDTTGNVTIEGNITVSGTVDGIDIATDVAANTLKPTLIDEDDMASDSDIRVPSQQSVKAYVDGLASNYATSAQGTTADSALQSYTETNDLSTAVTWVNVPDANITEGSVTQHEAALSIAESQITGLGTSAVLNTAAISDGGTGVATADQIHTFVTTQTDAMAADTAGQAGTVATIAGLAPNTATTQATQPNITTMTGVFTGQANHLITDNGDGTVTTETQLTYDGAGGLKISSGEYSGSPTANAPALMLENSDSSTDDCPAVQFVRRTTGADDQDLGIIQWNGDNDADEMNIPYASILGEIETAADTDEAGKLSLTVACSNGTTSALQRALVATGHGTSNIVSVGLGYGATSTTTIAGDLDIDGDNMTTAGAMTLTTGGAYEIATSSGNITLDSAGDIALEAAGNDVTVDTDNFVMSSSTNFSPVLEVLSTSNNSGSGVLKFNKQRADDSPEDDDIMGLISFAGEDANGAENFYGSIGVQAEEVDAGDEAGRMTLSVSNNGAAREGLRLTGATGTTLEVDVAIANGAASTTTIAGDLSITTGLLLDSVDITTIQTSSESFADNDTSLMTSAAIDDRIAANGVTFEIPGNTTGAFQGDVVYFGNTSGMTTGAIYMYTGATNQWVAADATAVADSDGLLAVALGGSSDTNGMLLRGMVVLDMAAGSTGDVVFLSTTPGDVTTTAPSGNNNVVRILGYTIVVANGVGAKIWFNPDNTFVEVTA